MSDPGPCPLPSQLSAFQRGDLIGADRERVAGHLTGCALCETLVQAMESAPATVQRPTTATLPDSIPTPNTDGQTRLGFRLPGTEEVADEGVELPPQPTVVRSTNLPPGANEPSTYPFLSPPMSASELGRIGGYRVLKLLGSGGMGMVFCAEDSVLMRPVALKVMRPNIREAEGTERMLREARSMAGIKHEHLVTVYQAGKEGDIFFLAMELLEGETLEARLSRPQRPELKEILRIGQEIAAGLEAIHRNGLIHRDIKPSNIWLEAPTARVKILDFGLARSIDGNSPSLTGSRMLVGTPSFMSPEQARCEPLDARSDLFSVGCVLYHLCTGIRPFQGSGVTEKLEAVNFVTPPPVRETNPQAPASLSALVDRMLSKEPANRPSSAAEVQSALALIEEELSPPPIAPEPLPAPKRSKWKAAALATVFAALGGIAVFAFFPSPPPDDEERGEYVPKARSDELRAMARKLRETLKGAEPLLNVGPANPSPGIYLPKESGQKGTPLPNAPQDMFARFSLRGELSPRGIGMHPTHRGPASVSFTLDGTYRTFQALVTQNDGGPPLDGEMQFLVIGDGSVIWRSKPVKSQSDTQPCEVPIAGVRLLTLRVDIDGSPRGAHGLWFEPHVRK